MQEASARTRRDKYLPFGRSRSPSLHLKSDFTVWLLCLFREEPNATPFELLALLLLPLPFVLTFQKLLELAVFGERSHQLDAEPERNVQSVTDILTTASLYTLPYRIS